MHGLMPVILAIILSSLITLSTANYMNFDNDLAQVMREQINHGLSEFQRATDQYREDTQVFGWTEHCHPTETSECYWDRRSPGNGDVGHEGSKGTVNTATWRADLIPDYFYEPSLPSGWSWTMGTDAKGTYTCINATHDDVSRRVLSYMIRRHSADRLSVGSSCAPATPYTVADVQSAANGPIYLTYWLHK